MDIIEPEPDGAAPKPREALFAHAHVLANLLRPAEPGRPELPPEHAALLRRMARDLDRFRRGDPPAPHEDVPLRADTPPPDATEDPRIAALTRRIEALERGMAGEATVAADALAPLRTLLEVLSVEVTRLRQGAGAVPPEAAAPVQVTAAPATPAPAPPASEAPEDPPAPPVRRASAGTVALRLAATLGAVTLLAGGLLAVWQPHFIPSRPVPMRPLVPPPVRAAVTQPVPHPPATHPVPNPVAAAPATKPHPPAHPLPSAAVATPVHPAAPPRSVAPPPKPEAAPHKAAAVPKPPAPAAPPQPPAAVATPAHPAPPPAAPRSVAPPPRPEAPPHEAAAVPKAPAPTGPSPASATAATPRTAAPPPPRPAVTPPHAPAAAPEASPPAAPHAASPAPAVIVPNPSPQRAAAPAGKPVPPVAIRAIADTWVSLLDAQGHTVLARLLHAGDTLVPPAPGLTLTTGNAGGTELVVNGHAGPPLGATGVVLHAVKLTPPPG